MPSKKLALLAGLLAAVAVTGCRSDNACRGGSCGSSPGNGYQSAPQSYPTPVANGVRPPAALPPAGSGSRGEGSGFR